VETNTDRTAPFTGNEYLDGLRDGREVLIHGECVADVTTHPAFRNSARSVAHLYDAMHAATADGVLSVETDTGSGGWTHPMFRAARSGADLLRQRDSVAAWARLSYGWLARTPDYKAGFASTLAHTAEFYGDFASSARRWYRIAQESCLYLNHTFVDLPRDRDSAAAGPDTAVRVVAERDGGIVVSGAKMVATNAALTSHNLVSSLRGTPQDEPERALCFMIAMNAPGVKTICRPSFEAIARRAGTPFDYPLSSRFDENDALVVMQDVFVPWEDVLIYRDPQRLAQWPRCGHTQNMMLQGCTRLAVKLDFLIGCVVEALKTTGKASSPAVRATVGELIGWRDMVWAMSSAMVGDPTQVADGAVLPNSRTSMAFRLLSQTLYPRIRNTINTLLASTLIVQPSGSQDWHNADMRLLLDVYYRGPGDRTAQQQNKIVRLLWDATQTEFGSRHDLFERTYYGSNEVVRLSQFGSAEADGTLAAAKELVDACLDDYDLDGWTVAHLK